MNKLDKFKTYTKQFVNDESGMELLQLAIVVTISVALITVVMYLKSAIESRINQSAEDVQNMPGMSGGSGTTPTNP